MAIVGIVQRLFIHRGQDHARRYGIDRDVLGRTFERHRLGQLAQPRLCRTIVRRTDANGRGVDRGDIDDGARMLPCRLPDELARRQECSRQIGV